jgi:hypothetical protein
MVGEGAQETAGRDEVGERRGREEGGKTEEVGRGRRGHQEQRRGRREKRKRKTDRKRGRSRGRATRQSRQRRERRRPGQTKLWFATWKKEKKERKSSSR